MGYFQFLGRGLAQDSTMPKFLPDSNSALSRLSNEVSEFTSEGDLKKQKV